MSHDIPKVSVGMPVFNAEQRLGAAVESVLGQTFRDLELIISDNASTDGTDAICREYAAKDPRVQYQRNARNLGATENFNIVFRCARGQYFKWATSNDLCDPAFIDACVKVLEERHDTVVAFPGTRLVHPDSGDAENYNVRQDLLQERPSDRFRAFLERRLMNNQLYGLIRAEVLRKIPPLGNYFGSDLVLLAELALHGKFVELPDFLFFRRTDSSEVTMSREKYIRAYHDPELKSRMLYQRWIFHRECFYALLRTPLPLHEKLRVFRVVLQLFWKERGHLARDLLEAGKARSRSANSSGVKGGQI